MSISLTRHRPRSNYRLCWVLLLNVSAKFNYSPEQSLNASVYLNPITWSTTSILILCITIRTLTLVLKIVCSLIARVTVVMTDHLWGASISRPIIARGSQSDENGSQVNKTLFGVSSSHATRRQDHPPLRCCFRDTCWLSLNTWSSIGIFHRAQQVPLMSSEPSIGVIL